MSSFKKIGVFLLLAFGSSQLLGMEVTNKEKCSKEKHATRAIKDLKTLCIGTALKNKGLTKNHIATQQLPLDVMQELIKHYMVHEGLIIEDESIVVCMGHTGPVRSVYALQTEEGYRIVSGSHDGTIRIWNLEGKQLAACQDHTDWVQSVHAFQTKDGWKIVSSSADNTVRIWDLNGKQLAVCQGHTKLVASAYAFQVEEDWRIVSGSDDGTVRVWDLNGNQLTVCQSNADSKVDLVYAFQTKEGWRIALCSLDNTVRIWGLNGNQLTTHQGHAGRTKLAYKVTEQDWRIASGFVDGTIYISDLEGNQLAICQGHTDWVRSVYAFNTEKGWRIVSGSSDCTVRVWDPEALLKKLYNMSPKQAYDILTVLESANPKERKHDKIKQILTTQEDTIPTLLTEEDATFNVKTLAKVSLLGVGVGITGYCIYKYFFQKK